MMISVVNQVQYKRKIPKNARSQDETKLVYSSHSPYRGITPRPPAPFQNYPPVTSPALPVNRSSQVFFINRNATVKLSSINTIHVKQQV